MFPLLVLLASSAPVPVPRPVPPPQVTPGDYVWYWGSTPYRIVLGGTPQANHGVYSCDGGYHGRWQWCPKHRIMRVEEAYGANGNWQVYQFPLDCRLNGPNEHFRLRRR